MDYENTDQSIVSTIVDQTAMVKGNLLSDLLFFTKTFYKLRTGRDFKITQPISRESHYTTIARALYRVFYGRCNKLIINVPPRYGKAIDIDTPVLTRNGWKTAGKIQIGDELVGSNGWTKITGVFPQGVLSAKEIFFNGNQSIICNSEHLWNVCDRYTPRFKTFTTKYIEDTLHEADGRKHWRIPLINGEYGEIKPFIDPYLFGCWLGDGITKNGFQAILRKHNLLNNKHIPDEVFRWSKSNRMALLQGLMDTDGTCNKKNGQVSFCNKNKSIIAGFCCLVNSLGGIFHIYHIKTGSDNVNIRLPDDIAPFRLQRKQKLVPRDIKCSPRRFISAIFDIEPRKMICFTVDAKDKLFAVGEGLILTHNSSLLINFVAWSLAHYPDSNFLYVSVSHDLATKATAETRNIITSPYYKRMFGVSLREDSAAKDSFATTSGGTVDALGSGSTIVGKGGGLRGSKRFGGCIVIDDIHKPDEVTSNVMRQNVIDWYYNTLLSRRNDGEKTPIVFIGQRLHEDDLAGHLLAQDGWESVILKAIDNSGNALCPELHTIYELRKMQKLQEYVFASQFQQNPQPEGGSLFKEENFPILEQDPHLLGTFITVDCAETVKNFNDATVFSLFGIYKIKQFGEDTTLYGIHWLNCVELFIEPKDLKDEFMAFYASSARAGMLPKFVAIEKKSAGVTLVSVLKDVQGLHVIAVDRTIKSGSKTDRFISMQSYISQKLVTFPYGAPHVKMCIDHCIKITSNNTHRRDDIADTLYDACNMVFIDKSALGILASTLHCDEKAKSILRSQATLNTNRSNRW